MPHKRKKASERARIRNKEGYNNAPNSSADDKPSKSISRVLDAERIQREYRERKRKSEEDSGEATSRKRQKPNNELKIRPDESLKKFSRRAEAELRPQLAAAMRRAAALTSHKKERRKRKADEIQRQTADTGIGHQKVDQRIAEKRAKAAEKDSEEKDFAKRQTTWSVNDIADAPPSLSFGRQIISTPRLAGQSSKKKVVPLSLGDQEALQTERQKAIERYRVLKSSKDGCLS